MKLKMDRSKLIVVLLLVFTAINFYYMDIHSNIRQGINVWEALFSGNFLHYYSINLISVEKGEMIHPANYDMVMNILMGIWQLPLYILEKILHTNIQQYTLAKIWGGLYPMIALLLSGEVLKRIALQIHMSEEQAENAEFMFLTSTYALTAGCVVAQADCIGLWFILLAIENLLSKKNKKFLLFFILAAQCKFFALFIFIPIILLREKNLLKIALQAITPLAVSFIIDLPFKLADPIGAGIKKSRLHDMIYSITENRVSVLGMDIPVVFIVFSLICIYAYLKSKPKENERWYLYIGGGAVIAVLFCFKVSPYWMIYMAPFFCLLTMESEENLERKLLAETVASISITVGFIIAFHWIYDTQSLLVTQGGIPGMGGGGGPLCKFSEFLSQEKYYNVWTVFYGIFAAWTVTFLIDHFPGRDTRGCNEHGYDMKYVRLLLWGRAIAGFAICNISLFIYFILAAE